MEKTKNPQKYLIWLKIIVIVFLVSGLLIGALNKGFADKLNDNQQHLVHWLYLIYENVIRALIVIISSLLTIKYIKAKNSQVDSFKVVSLTCFSITMFLLFIVLPIVTNFWELYSAFMPFPWSTMPLQIIAKGKFFSYDFHHPYGTAVGQRIVLYAYFAFQFIVLTGTVILGRRWQCSMICPFGGCHSASFGNALPLKSVKKTTKTNKKVRKVLEWLKILGFILMIGLFVLWAIYLLTGYEIIPLELLLKFEMIKYMSLELMLMYLLWIFFNGRGYCYYCPAGMMLGILGRGVGQQIKTDLTKCTDCGLCNDACRMGIDIRSKALSGQPVTDLNCIGCDQCVAACPHDNLEYSTNLLTKIKVWRESKEKYQELET